MFCSIIIPASLILIAAFDTASSYSAALFGEACIGEASGSVMDNNFDVTYKKLCSSDLHLTCDPDTRKCACIDEYYPDFITGDNPDGSACRYVDGSILDLEDEDDVKAKSNAEQLRISTSVQITTVALISISYLMLTRI